MEYTDELAEKIAEKHSISAVTLRIWKHRGKIPDVYADENYVMPEAAPLKHTLRALEILSLPEINTAGLISIKLDKARDVKAFHLGQDPGKTQNFTTKEIADLRSELTRLRNLLREFTQSGSEKAIKAIIRSKQIKHYILFGYENNKMFARISRGSEAYPDEVEHCRVMAASLYDKIKF